MLPPAFGPAIFHDAEADDELAAEPTVSEEEVPAHESDAELVELVGETGIAETGEQVRFAAGREDEYEEELLVAHEPEFWEPH